LYFLYVEAWTADDYVRRVLEFLDSFALVRRGWP
jgi:hypothetical protein